MLTGDYTVPGCPEVEQTWVSRAAIELSGKPPGINLEDLTMVHFQTLDGLRTYFLIHIMPAELHFSVQWQYNTFLITELHRITQNF